MSNAAYWKKRFELLEQSQNQLGVQCYADIEKQYRQAQKSVEGQLSAWYQRFATNNDVTVQEARKMLTKKELQELKWDINEYIRYGRENAINGTWVKQLENASAKFHISRLEALKIHMQQSLEVMFGNQLDTLDAAMRDVYKSGYYHTAYEIQKGVGVGWDFATLDEKQISKVINKPWAADGKNFSERIWGNRQKLVNELNTELTRNIILGQDPKKAIDAIARKMNVSKNNAGALVMTEEAFFSSASQRDCFNELDVEQFEIVATLDSVTSELCRDMDGKHFPMSQWEIGVTAPPFHVRCRTTTVPYFEDNFDVVEERAARNADGEVYYVPADMKYRDWEKAFVDGDKSGLQEIKADDTIKSKKTFEDIDEEIAELEKEQTDLSGWGTYDEIIADFGSVDDYFEDDDPNASIFKTIQQKILNLKNDRKQIVIDNMVNNVVPKKQMTIVDALQANPNHNKDASYTINCQRCVQAYELRRRGYDVVAKPKGKKGDNIAWGSECFISSGTNAYSAYTMNQTEKMVKDELNSAPDGARYSIYIKWKNNSSAHVFIAEKENGVVRYVDPQVADDNVEHYFNLGSSNKYGFFRMDDKPIVSDQQIILNTVEVR